MIIANQPKIISDHDIIIHDHAKVIHDNDIIIADHAKIIPTYVKITNNCFGIFPN